MSSTPSRSRFGGNPPAAAASSDNRVHSSQRGVGRQSGTREIQVRQAPIAARIGPGPGSQRQVEGSDLRAARIDLQAEQVVPPHGVDRVARCEPFLVNPQADQQIEALDQEVAAAAAGIEHAEVGRRAGPSLEAPGRRPPRPRRLPRFVSVPRLTHESQVREVVAPVRFQAHGLPQLLLARGGRGEFRWRGQDPARTPRADGVVQQEQHHVALGEELRHGGQLVGPDLHAALVDHVLPLRLPELIGPAQGVARGEDVGRQRLDQPLQFLPRLRRQPDGERRVVAPEDPRQHQLGEAAGQHPAVLPLLMRQLLAVRQRHGDSGFGFDEELVLRQEAGEQHPVPVLVGRLVGEAVDLLLAGLRVAPIPELTSVRPQASPQVQFRGGHRRVRARIAHREDAERVAGAGFTHAPRRLDGRGEPVAQVSG